MNLNLPALNACLNGVAAALLLAGFVAIRTGRRGLHIRCMLGATGVSALFLISYLTYHATHGSTRFQGQGPVRTLYFAILLTHTVLAAVNVPLVLVTLYRAGRGRWEAHRRLARVTWPVWMYVSVTGVAIYLLLYHGPGSGT